VLGRLGGRLHHQYLALPGSGGEGRLGLESLGVEALQHRGEVVAREAPIERPCCLVVAILEALETIRERGEVSEIRRLDDLALNDRKHDLDLIQSGGVHGEMNEAGVGPRRSHPLDRSFPDVG